MSQNNSVIHIGDATKVAQKRTFIINVDIVQTGGVASKRKVSNSTMYSRQWELNRRQRWSEGVNVFGPLESEHQCGIKVDYMTLSAGWYIMVCQAMSKVPCTRGTTVYSWRGEQTRVQMVRERRVATSKSFFFVIANKTNPD